MKKLIRLALVLLSVAGAIYAAEPSIASKPATSSPYTALESLIGGTWVATMPPQKDGTVINIEMTFDWAANRQGVSFVSTFVKGEKRAPYSNGLYAWNAAKGKLVFFYTDSGAALSEGAITPEGDALVHEFTITNRNGTIDTARSRLTKLGSGAFTNEIFLLKETSWTKIVEVRYEHRR